MQEETGCPNKNALILWALRNRVRVDPEDLPSL
jgi:hypothetical protein